MGEVNKNPYFEMRNDYPKYQAMRMVEPQVVVITRGCWSPKDLGSKF